MAELFHETGQAFNDPRAPGGAAWAAKPLRDKPGEKLFFGPYATDIGVGANRAVFRLRQRGAPPDALVASIAVENPQGIDEPVRRELFGRDFPADPRGYAEFALDFDHRGRGGVVLETLWSGEAWLSAGAVEIKYMQQPRKVPSIEAGEFHLRGGDRVVFFGDSIAEQGLYARYLEAFQKTARPRERVEFFNAGVAGDTSEGGLARLDADVLSLDPTVAVIGFGMNDSGYAQWREGLDARLAAYRDRNRRIVERLQFFGVRVYFLTPFRVDYNRRPDLSAANLNECLRLFADIQADLSREMNLPAPPADWGAAIEAVRTRELARDPGFHFADDGIHPGPRAHLAAADVLLRAWNARPVVEKLAIRSPLKDLGDGAKLAVFREAPLAWSPENVAEDWLGADWMRLELSVSERGGPWKARVNGGEPFLLEALRPRNIAALWEAASRLKAARGFDEAIERKNLARFDRWRRRPNIPPLEPENETLYEEYRESFEKVFRKRQEELDAFPRSMEIEVELLPAIKRER